MLKTPNSRSPTILEEEAKQLQSFKRRRKTTKSKITRLNTLVENFDVSSGNLEFLETYLQQAESVAKDYSEIHDGLIYLLNDEELDAQEEKMAEFELTYFNVKSNLSKYIKQMKVKKPVSAGSENNSVQVKLPKIPIPTFSGEYEKWVSYKDAFEALIHSNHSISDIQKYYYLRDSLKDEALRTIEKVDFSKDGYDSAWAELIKRYDNKRRIIEKHIERLFNVKQMTKESATELRQLLDTCTINLRALKTLEQNINEWDMIIVYLVSSKMDLETRKEWEMQIPIEDEDGNTILPTWDNMQSFLTTRCKVLESIEGNKLPSHQKGKYINNKSLYVSDSQKKCPLCEQSHLIWNCETFLQLSPEERYNKVIRLKWCLNCLRPGHMLKDCSFSGCKECKKKHNSLLHRKDRAKDQQVKVATPLADNAGAEQACSSNNTVTTHHATGASDVSSSVVLSTAVVGVFDNMGSIHYCRVLIDSGSQSHFISERFCKILGTKLIKVESTIGGIGGSTKNIKFKTSVKVKSRLNNFSRVLEAYLLPKITCRIPSQYINKNNWNIPGTVTLADPEFNIPSKIDMLIGAEIFLELLSVGQIKLSKDVPLMQKTVFGWIVSGKVIDHQSFTSTCHAVLENIDEYIQRFWQIEQPEVQGNSMSKEEMQCEKLFMETTTRDDSGKFIVRLPINSTLLPLGESLQMATKRFLNLENKLKKNHNLKTQYHDFIHEYKKLNHMDLTTFTAEGNYFMPHHCVLKPDSSTTKLRVVFDASANTSSGNSLNNALLVGPTVQQDLFSIILRFRVHRYVMTADISKMYRQIWVHEADRHHQCIVWRDEADQELQAYQLKTVTYGTASAPYLATRCLKQLALDEKSDFPEASAKALSDFYVDDVMTGANTLKEALFLQQQLIQMMEKGGFDLHKWCANHEDLLETIPEAKREVFLKIDETESIKALGLIWMPKQDSFKFNVKQNTASPKLTKRIILSNICRLFDPLGYVNPVIVTAKLLMQQLWQLKIDWDESVPINIHTSWTNYSKQLSAINKLNIDRCLLPQDSTQVMKFQLHGFSDASEAAYGACLYIRCEDNFGKFHTQLLCAKSRIAPLKKISLPRLELCAAQLLANLAKRVISILNINFNKIYYWTDSTIVLCWINSSSANWKTFVANRVTDIQENSNTQDWNHISTKINPADYVSRGMMPEEIINKKLWWNGPEFLLTSEESWPKSIQESLEDIPEKRKISVLLATKEPSFEEFFNRFSSYSKMLKVTAYCLRFIRNCRNKANERNFESLSKHDIQDARNKLVKIVQREWKADILHLQETNCVSNKSKLLSLNPFLDSEGIIRVGGRLSKSNLAYETKHQILVPSNHHFTKLLIQSEHIKLLHAGPQATLAAIRQTFWPMNGRNSTRCIIRKCVVCFRNKPKILEQFMGDLPADRVQGTKPFSICGVDYCGPFSVYQKSIRTKKVVKAWIAVFVCFSTKAIHLELVGDMTTASFLGALKRFIGRRGKCSIIYSDNSTTFIKANKDLKELQELVRSAQHNQVMYENCLQEGIEWKFIPPRAPHFGGLWEAGVKSVKFHLYRVLQNSHLTYEEFSTVLCQIEAALNSRPISPLSSDPNDFQPLTPGHFLIGQPLTAVMEPNLLDINEGRLSRWQRVQQIYQHFWKRWYKEYLATQQQRSKWNKINNIKIGSMVIIKEDNMPPMKWPLGRILELHPGQDGICRVVTVDTSHGIFKRPVARLCILPFETDNSV